MTTIHIIESDEERALIKKIFREHIADAAEAAMDMGNNVVEGGMNYKLNGDAGMAFCDGAIVYDIVGEGDPELGWMVYDFRGDGRCYAVCEWDTAGLMSLPSKVFPF